MSPADQTCTHEEWVAEAIERFGADPLNWAFVCPVCGTVQTVQEYKAAGAPSTAAGFSCIGRWLEDSREAFEVGGVDGEGGPCNYAGGGLFHLNPVHVTMPDGEIVQAFAFAKE